MAGPSVPGAGKGGSDPGDRSPLWAALGALPGLGLLGAFNAAVTGSPLVPPTVWAGKLGLGAEGIVGVERDVDPSRRALVFTLWRATDLADTGFR